MLLVTSSGIVLSCAAYMSCFFAVGAAKKHQGFEAEKVQRLVWFCIVVGTPLHLIFWAHMTGMPQKTFRWVGMGFLQPFFLGVIWIDRVCMLLWDVWGSHGLAVSCMFVVCGLLWVVHGCFWPSVTLWSQGLSVSLGYAGSFGRTFGSLLRLYQDVGGCWMREWMSELWDWLWDKKEILSISG